MRVLGLLAFCGLLLSAQDKPPEKKAAAQTANSPEETPSITHHTLTLRGKTLPYTATAARLPIKNSESGQTEAQMFYVSYVLDGGSGLRNRRPITFLFNGGPGSATIWLHMGCFGPKRVRMLPDGGMPPPPFRWEDNPDTILDRSDLVFIDAVGTGYSRATNAELAKKFWSVQGDIAAFGEFIRLYLQRNSRWTSPVYLAGESYGTTRAAGLSGYLVDHGIALNGIVLISTVLNFQTLSFDAGNDLPYVLFLPTYAVTSAFHHKLSTPLAKDLPSLQKEVEHFASGPYLAALQQGDALSPAEKDAIAARLAEFTGLSKDYILRSNLRVDLPHYNAELLRQEGRTVGRLDARFTGVNESGTAQRPDFDPSEAVIRPPFTAAFGNYVRQELGYESDLTYYVLGGGVHNWDFSSGQQGRARDTGYADTSEALRHAFAKNPYLHVYVAEGLYDAATPYFAAEYTLNHMGLKPEDHSKITRSRFSAGHMVYIDKDCMAKLHTEVDQFLAQTSAAVSE